MNHVKAGDLVITQDIGWASTFLLKKVNVLSPRESLLRKIQSIRRSICDTYPQKQEEMKVYGKGPNLLRLRIE
jgi:uncharacterized protein